MVQLRSATAKCTWNLFNNATCTSHGPYHACPLCNLTNSTTAAATPRKRAAELVSQVSQHTCLDSRSKTSISSHQHPINCSHSIAIAHAFSGSSGARAHVLQFTAAAWSLSGCAQSGLCRPRTDSTPPDLNAASSAPPPYWPPAQPMHGPAQRLLFREY